MQVFKELSVSSWSSVSALNSCIGNIDEDHQNTIMEAEMKSQRGGGSTGEASHIFFTHFQQQCIQAMHTVYMGTLLLPAVFTFVHNSLCQCYFNGEYGCNELSGHWC